MDLRNFSLGVASAVTTFLVVGGVTILVASSRYGDGPGVGIVGVLVGFVAGLLAGVAVVALADRLAGVPAAALVAYATFGVAFLAIAGLSYVNVPGADRVFTFPVHLGTSVLVAVGVAVASFVRGEERRGMKPSV